MMITPKTVPSNIPPAAAEPMVLLPMAPAPLANINGISPAINAKDVIRIGLRRSDAASTAALNGVIPSLCFKEANSTMSIAFFPSSPISMIIATWAYILFSSPIIHKKKKAPKTPAGSERMTGNGNRKLSYCAESKR